MGSGTKSRSGITKIIAESSLMNCAMAGKTTAAPAAMASKIKESFRMIVRQWPNTLLCRKRHGLVVGEGWHSGGGVCGCRRKWSGSFLSSGKVLRFHLGGLERHRRIAPTCRAPTALCFITFGNLGRCLRETLIYPQIAQIRADFEVTCLHSLRKSAPSADRKQRPLILFSGSLGWHGFAPLVLGLGVFFVACAFSL